MNQSNIFTRALMGLLVLLMCNVANGQTVVEEPTDDAAKPFFCTQPAEQIVTIEVGATMGASSFMQNYGSQIPMLTDLYITPGVKMGLGANVGFGIRDFLSLYTGLWFNVNNSRYAMALLAGDPTSSLSSLFVRNRYYTAEVPIYVSFQFNVAKNVRWHVDGGIYLAQGLGGKTDVSTYVSGTNELGQAVVSMLGYKYDYYDDETALIHSVRKTDYGLRFGTGMTFNHHWHVSILTHIGLRNLALNHGVYNCRQHTLDAQLMVGYVF